MNRTDRLYAIVEELRAVSPRPRSTRWLASRFGVSSRTIERDIAALQQTGAPLYAEPGRTGGYVLERTASLPPLNIKPVEAVTIALALQHLDGTPLAEPARVVLQKIVAVMAARDVRPAEELARRFHQVHAPGATVARATLPDPSTSTATPAVIQVVLDALVAGRVLELTYLDRSNTPSARIVEPTGCLAGSPVNRDPETGRPHWYLMAWCRLRGAVRLFRLDRIVQAYDTGELAPARDVDLAHINFPDRLVSRVTLR